MPDRTTTGADRRPDRSESMKKSEMNGWGAATEVGTLTDVLLCPPVNYRWLPTSAISKATLASGASFDAAAAAAQHEQLVDSLTGAGVRCHFLEPDEALPYQIFTRDSSVMTPFGAVISQLNQPWRRGEYSPVLDFYAATGVPVWKRVTAGPLEGGDFMFITKEKALIGVCEARTTYEAAAQLAGWLAAEGIDTRIEPIPARYVHMDVICCMVDEGLVAVCSDVASHGLLRWFNDAGVEAIEVSSADAMLLGANVLALGGSRVVSAAAATDLNAALRARGLTVLAPELDAFTRGGGSAHCLTQALRRND